MSGKKREDINEATQARMDDFARDFMAWLHMIADEQGVPVAEICRLSGLSDSYASTLKRGQEGYPTVTMRWPSLKVIFMVEDATGYAFLEWARAEEVVE